MRSAFFAAVIAAFLVAPAQAQVYKCTENGKTVFSDVPCATGAKRVDVRPATGGYDADAAARARMQTERIKQQQALEDSERAAARRSTETRIAAERQAKVDKCRKIREERDDAKYWASEFKHKDNIKREQAKQKGAQDALWWECREVW